MQDTLIQWYKDNHRLFPWRIDDHPYHIWISEIMLQQTTTEAVIPYYQRFIETFPDISSLASASLEDVYKMWEGLGYYRRAKHIHETAQIIMKEYNGIFPKEYQDILNLKGIGSYTAGAILSIAYHQCFPAVDGNVLRIISRVDLLEDNIALTKTQKMIEQRVYDYIQGYDASSFNQGLMDLGATICRPLHPRCDLCPIQKFCKAYKHHQQDVLPIRIKKVKKQDLNYLTGIITYKNQFMFIKNPPGGLLENLYGCVQYDVESPYSFVEKFEEDYHCSLNTVGFIKDIKHVFTHRTWYMHVYHFTLDQEIDGLYDLSQLDNMTLSTAHMKVLKAYLKDREEYEDESHYES